MAGVHLPCWTTAATRARTSASLERSRAVSPTARASGAKRRGPAVSTSSGIRAVRRMRTKPALLRCLESGISTSMTLLYGARTPQKRSAATPVRRLPGPAYSNAATSRWSGVAAPVTVRNTPGNRRCHDPPARSRWSRAFSVIPLAKAWLRVMTWYCRALMAVSAARSNSLERGMPAAWHLPPTFTAALEPPKYAYTGHFDGRPAAT
jgi:hypothetical protein